MFPSAKINLGLHVHSKREDDYHEMETCMYTVPINDVLEILHSNTFQFVQTGITIPYSQDHNLCVSAYKLLKEDFDLGPVFIHLRKEIPIGAGLGGGSSDAASVLMGLNELFDLGISFDELENYASKLGSDCPFFIRKGTQMATGRGELLNPINFNLKGYFIKLIHPGIHISTKEAYSNVYMNPNEPSIENILNMEIESWKENLSNHFEINAFQSYPILAEIKEKLYSEGAIYASMSGSGSCMFAIYNSEPKLSFIERTNYFETIRRL